MLTYGWLAARLNRLQLLRSPCVTLDDRRNRDDTVSRARRSPSAIKHDAIEHFLVAAAEERAMQPLRAVQYGHSLRTTGVRDARP